MDRYPLLGNYFNIKIYENVFFALCFAMSAILTAIAQNPIEYRLNSNYGFSDPNGKKNIIVNFPRKTAREIYTKMAVNIGVLYYQPSDAYLLLVFLKNSGLKRFAIAYTSSIVHSEPQIFSKSAIASLPDSLSL